ncbi:MAG: hybrid sensor histidine kinase/response regulator [Cyanobacteria bacterium SW_9_44_58]|nr:MAG: hybrid sensor histidine kinase/response regulator [Cyanobacteria bacterium SW_9_44_58]
MSHSLDTGKPQSDTILVVDDSPDNVLLVQSILEEEGYQIDVAEEGETAIEKVNVAPPQLILLDVMMPGMDGFEVTERIRQQEDLPFIPILLITAYDQPSVAKGLDSGADDFIRKPVELEELLARVRSLLRLKHSVDERDEIARQRADFVSRLTHDLRTPLVAADRMLNLFQQGALGEMSPQMEEAVATMTRSNRNLLDMVNTLLEVYRFEAGRKVLNFATVDVKEIINEVIQELTPLAEEKGLSLKKQDKIDDEQLTEVEGDRLELRRVFTNLVGNAIKFTDEGSVEVRLKQQEQATTPELVIEVEDTGPGVSPEEQKTLFERFRKGKHQNSGSGLGLHLSQRILESHNGSITLDSEVGKGSTFTVKLPVKQE